MYQLTHLHSSKLYHSDDVTRSNETLVLIFLLFCDMVLFKAICWAIIILTRI